MASAVNAHPHSPPNPPPSRHPPQRISERLWRIASRGSKTIKKTWFEAPGNDSYLQKTGPLPHLDAINKCVQLYPKAAQNRVCSFPANTRALRARKGPLGGEGPLGPGGWGRGHGFKHTDFPKSFENPPGDGREGSDFGGGPSRPACSQHSSRASSFGRWKPRRIRATAGSVLPSIA